MRIFMTGASGYIGSVVAEKAVEQGHTIVGLARSEPSQQKLQEMGVTPLPGDLESLDLLTRAAADSDVVLHLGFVHEFHRPYDELLAIDIAAIRAMGKGIAGTGKPLIMTSGTGVTEPDSNGGETNEESPITETPLKARVEAEQAALELASIGVRPIVMRLAPYVYGRGGSVFVPALLKGCHCKWRVALCRRWHAADFVSRRGCCCGNSTCWRQRKPKRAPSSTARRKPTSSCVICRRRSGRPSAFLQKASRAKKRRSWWCRSSQRSWKSQTAAPAKRRAAFWDGIRSRSVDCLRTSRTAHIAKLRRA